MGTPVKPDNTKGMKDILETISSEIISAQSALNMHPEPIPDHGSRDGYLSETDGWAKHAMEHLQNIGEWQRIMQDKLNQLEYTIDRLPGTIEEDTLEILYAALRGPKND